MSAAAYYNGELMFEAVDVNQNGSISHEEFNNYLKSFNCDDAEFAKFVFSQIDADGNGVLSKEEFSNFNVKYHVSKDENCPSKYFFGKIDF